MLKLTKASYWRPSNRNIHRAANAKESDAWGVSPDPGYEVKISEEQLADIVAARQQRDIYRPSSTASKAVEELPALSDPQLKRALEYVEK
jgi:carboxyl-terminal processing protease